ncbi:MAG: ABC transporter permease subunit [Gammaproteobacteria bacterium]
MSAAGNPAVADPNPERTRLGRFGQSPGVRMVAFLLLAITLLVLFGPFLSPYAIDQVDWQNVATRPSFANGHWFGTDNNGRDLFVRTLRGGQISLLVGISATLVSVIIGVSYGAVAGYAGGRVDQVMMRLVDVLYAMPFMFFVILLMVLFGRNLLLMFIAIGAINWLDMARIVRGQTLSLKHREFVDAARALGVPPAAILWRHIVPNVMGVVVVYASLAVPQMILVESFLSFLGLGVQEPMTSWGQLVSLGAREMESAPWMLLFPASFLAVTLYCLNMLGDALRRYHDVASYPRGVR